VELDRGWNKRLEQNFAGLRERVLRIKEDVLELLQDGKYVGYGASTKGNTLLQHFGVGPELLPCIVDINPDKHGRVTPGTKIPIVAEHEGRDYFVLPWHFRQHILNKEEDFRARGGKIAFPLPEPDVYGRGGLEPHRRVQAAREASAA
jgi:hypothetical protein